MIDGRPHDLFTADARPRVLHLLESGTDTPAGTMFAAATLAMAIPGFSHRAWLIGGAEAERHAGAIGINTTDRVPVPGGSLGLAARAVARLAEDRAPPDIICAWSLPALWLARRVFGFRAPRVGVVAGPPPLMNTATGPALPLRWAWAADGVRIIAAGRTAWSAWSRIPDVDARLAGTPAWSEHAVRGFTAQRERVRAELGLSADDTGVLLLGDPPTRADAVRFAFITGVQFVAGQEVAGIVREGSAGVRRAARFVRAHSRRWGLSVSRHPLPLLLSAADLAVCLDDPLLGRAVPPAATISLAISIGAPIVASPSPAASEALGELASVCIATGAADRPIASRMVALTGDPLARAEISRAGRQIAAAAVGAFERDLASVWHEMLARIDVHPGLPVPRILEGTPA